MNLDNLHDDLIAAINQMYVMDEKFPHSNYRVQLVNRLGKYVNLIKRKQNRKQPATQAVMPIDKPEPYLPWDE